MMIAWKPPEELAEKALDPETGGGKPSIIHKLGNRPWALGDGYEVEALLLELDGKPCFLSLARVNELGIHSVNCTTKQIAEMLVRCLGGEIVTVA